MKEKIYAYIAAHPYCRQREIASSLRVWLCDADFLSALHGLYYEEHRIDFRTYVDSAQMEIYNEWYVVS